MYVLFGPKGESRSVVKDGAADSGSWELKEMMESWAPPLGFSIVPRAGEKRVPMGVVAWG